MQPAQRWCRPRASSSVSRVQLRGYADLDLPVLHALDQVCFPPGIAYSLPELRSFLHHPSSFTTVAFSPDRGEPSEESVLGFAIVRPVRRRVRGASREPVPALHVLTIDVAPLARRQGVGGLLMQWIFAQGARLQTRAIVLEVAVDNYAAQRFYAYFGFTVTATIPGYYNGLVDAFELERLLDPVVGQAASMS